MILTGFDYCVIVLVASLFVICLFLRLGLFSIVMLWMVLVLVVLLFGCCFGWCVFEYLGLCWLLFVCLVSCLGVA